MDHPALAPPPPLTTAATSITSSAIRDLLAQARRPDLVSLAGGLPAPELLPERRLAEAFDRVLTARARTALQYGLTEGEPELRELAAHTTGAAPDDIVITSGSQQGLDLVCRALVAPGAPVLVSAVDYPGALQCLASHGADLVVVPADESGIDVDAVADLLGRGVRPVACYVVPDHANPTGAVLSADRRVALVSLAERHGFVVVEDSPYRDLWFRTPPPPSLPASDAVVRLRSTSKIVAPGLRVGWVATPRWLTAAIVRLKQCSDLQTATLAQLVVADVLGDEPWLASHLDRLRTEYRRRGDTLARALRHHLRDRLDLRPMTGGMFLWGRLPGLDTTRLLSVALDAGVSYVPGAVFHVGHTDPSSVRLSFTGVAHDELDVAAARLARAVATTTGPSGGDMMEG